MSDDTAAFMASLFAKAQAKPAARKPSPRTLAETPIERAPIPDPYTDIAVALVTTTSRCACGASHTAPERNLYLLRSSRAQGSRLEPLWAITPLHRKLPRQRIDLPVEVDHCHTCFDPSHLDDQLACPDLFPESRPQWHEQRSEVLAVLRNPRYLDTYDKG